MDNNNPTSPASSPEAVADLGQKCPTKVHADGACCPACDHMVGKCVHPEEFASSPEATQQAEICWICQKLKGQSPERCNGHYEELPTQQAGQTAPSENAVIRCNHCKGTVLYKRVDGEFHVIHSCDSRLANTQEIARALVAALKPFAECNRGWVEEGKRSEIRFDWLQHAADALSRAKDAGLVPE